MKILTDTLKTNNKWSQKRLLTLSSFFVSTIYAFIPIFLPNFEVKEFIFLGFLGVGGFSIYRTQKTNENNTNLEP
jgi:hypothetical protein